MPARRCNFQGSFDVLLAFDIRKIDLVVAAVVEKLIAGFNHHRFKAGMPVEDVGGFLQVVDAIHFDVVDNGSFSGVLFGQNETFELFFAGLNGNGQSTFDGAE